MTDDERDAARKLGEAEFAELFPEMIGEAEDFDTRSLQLLWRERQHYGLGYMLMEMYDEYCHSVLKSQQIVQSAPYDDE